MATVHQIVRTARPGSSVVGWKLSVHDRHRLLARFQPTYARTIADHVTLAARVAPDTSVPADTAAQVIGHADDGQGVGALVVAIGGSPARPDGSTYHITWSLGEDRQANESNAVIADTVWSTLDEPIPIQLEGARIT